MAATLNDHLDYFGATVNMAVQLVERARAGEVLYTHEVAGDPSSASLLAERGPPEILPAPPSVRAVLYRLRPSSP